MSQPKPNPLAQIRSRLGKVKDAIARRAKLKSLPAEKLLLGGEQGIRPAKYAELTGDFFRPSTLFSQSPYCQFLAEYDRRGRDILKDGVFQQTGYHRNALKCIGLYGIFGRHGEADLPMLAEKLITDYEQLRKEFRAGEKSPAIEPLIVRRVKHSDYFSVMEGSHRAATAIAAGYPQIPALLPDSEPILTPLQQLLLDVQWTESKLELYQPVDSPEIRSQWSLVRKCTDRMQFMKRFLEQSGSLPQSPGMKSYLDLGSSYGWFVRQFTDLGFSASGVERDPVAIEVGLKVYGLAPAQITAGDIVKYLKQETKSYEVVSLLSVLHHFVRGKNFHSAEELLRQVDKITRQVLFFDMGQEHEPGFKDALKGWTPEFIAEWVRTHSNFRQVVPLGIDGDSAPPHHLLYGRTLFACVKNSA